MAGIPEAIATRGGTMQPLPNSGNMAADVLDALEHMSIDCPFSEEEMTRILRLENFSAGLRGEAGYGGSSVVILHSYYEPLASGSDLQCWLTVAQGSVFWTVSTTRSRDTIFCASSFMRDAVFTMLRTAAGGKAQGELPSRRTARDEWRDVPTQRQIDAIN